MNEAGIKAIIKKGEGISIEFKECKRDVSKNVYDTVCAFLNRNGGELLLGVDDNGRIMGIDAHDVERIKKDFVTVVNNPQKISPAFYLTIELVRISGKLIIYIYVPENSNLVAGLYLRKQTSYSENRAYPFVTMKDLRSDRITQARKLATIQKASHPWAKLSDIDLIKSAQMYLKDYQTGKKGFTLAAVLIFGKDEVLLSVLPHFRTDAILRKENVDLYDDRDNIFREIIVNLLIHREFLNAFPAKLVIEKDRIYTENSNKPHGYGLIDPTNFSPFPKNQVIAGFLKQIAWAEELGSGVRKLAKYGKIYFGSQPQCYEKDVFKMTVATAQVTAQVG